MTQAQAQEIDRLKTALEAMTVERSELAVRLHAAREIVSIGWKHGRKPCPFCNGLSKHQTYCYLETTAGKSVVQEFHEIETQRDYLLGQLANLGQEAPANMKRSLKSKFASLKAPKK